MSTTTGETEAGDSSVAEEPWEADDIYPLISGHRDLGTRPPAGCSSLDERPLRRGAWSMAFERLESRVPAVVPATSPPAEIANQYYSRHLALFANDACATAMIGKCQASSTGSSASTRLC